MVVSSIPAYSRLYQTYTGQTRTVSIMQIKFIKIKYNVGCGADVVVVLCAVHGVSCFVFVYSVWTFVCGWWGCVVLQCFGVVPYSANEALAQIKPAARVSLGVCPPT